MTKAEKELKAIRHELTEWEATVAQAILRIPPGRLITYGCLARFALGYDASRAVANLRGKLYGLLDRDNTAVPLHRITKQGELASDSDSPRTRRENAKRRRQEGTPQDKGAWWCPE